MSWSWNSEPAGISDSLQFLFYFKIHTGEMEAHSRAVQLHRREEASQQQIHLNAVWIFQDDSRPEDSAQPNGNHQFLFSWRWKNIFLRKFFWLQALSYLKKMQEIIKDTNKNRENTFRTYCLEQYLTNQLDIQNRIANNSELDKK